MAEMNRAHQGRMAIRTFQVLAHALLLRGRYSLGGQSGQAMESALRTLNTRAAGKNGPPPPKTSLTNWAWRTGPCISSAPTCIVPST